MKKNEKPKSPKKPNTNSAPKASIKTNVYSDPRYAKKQALVSRENDWQLGWPPISEMSAEQYADFSTR